MTNQAQAKRVLVTSALPYSNGDLHVGHLAGCYLPSDIFVRFLRMKGLEVRSVCGSDDHGVALMLTAAKQGKTPAEVADYYNARQQQALEGLDIKFDVYGSTSRNPYHAKTSQDFFLAIHKKGFFEKVETEQFYDPQKEMFLPDRFVKGRCAHCNALEQNGDQCEQCGEMLDTKTLLDAKSVVTGSAAIVKKTVHWFLDLSRCEKEVREWLANATIREHTRKYVECLLSTGLVRRSMTRDISWGIPVPLEDEDAKGKVLYVWFDAPIGYISNTKELCQRMDGTVDTVSDWWNNKDTSIYHFIGEDNTIFHTVIWIAMLSAAGSYSLPTSVVVNHFLDIKLAGKEAEKMSKSRGTAIWILEYLQNGGNSDMLRYYLTAIAPEKVRTAFNPDDLAARNNSDLADTIGNFVNRIIQFTLKNVGTSVPAINPAKETEVDKAFAAEREQVFAEVSKSLDECCFRAALDRLVEFARSCNRYVDARAPWKLKKSDPESVGTVLHHSLAAIKLLGVMLMPFIPKAAGKICKAFGMSPETVRWQQAVEAFAEGTVLTAPEILFQKVEKEVEK